MSPAPAGSDQKRNAALLLSVTGAAVAGIGAGALFGEALRPIAAAILSLGIVAHLVGMIGNHRAQSSTGYQFKWWEAGAYWLCWALIAALSAYLAMRLMRFI